MLQKSTRGRRHKDGYHSSGSMRSRPLDARGSYKIFRCAFNLALLSPIPKSSSSVETTQKPAALPGSNVPLQYLFARCSFSCAERWCGGCGMFWREDHYTTNRQIDKSRHANACTHRSTSYRWGGDSSLNLNVHLGLCVEHCLVKELYQGSDGMWA